MAVLATHTHLKLAEPRRPVRGCRLNTEAPNWGIPRGPQEVSSGGHRLHEAGRGGLTGRGSLDCRHRGDGRELTTIRLAG